MVIDSSLPLPNNLRISFLIVVPTLNSSHLLPRLVSSLKVQTWKSWRVLFIDGPSSDLHRHWLDSCCSNDSRFSWIKQSKSESGIFGAMNHGFAEALSTESILFWGSDDWAAGPNALYETAFCLAQSFDGISIPDLCVCSGRYVNNVTGDFSRFASFRPPGLLNLSSYLKSVWQGYIPPHQATVFNPSLYNLFDSYDTQFRLAADLDYFLRLFKKSDLRVLCSDLELVHMSEGGASACQPIRRTFEVFKAYSKAFGFNCLLPVIARYLRRGFSLIKLT